MPLNKNAYLRYQIVDECLTNRSMKYPSPEKIMDVIERKIDQRISKETFYKDIQKMKRSSDLGYHAPIKYAKSEKGYYYDDPNYSIKAFPVNYEDIESAEFALTLLNKSKKLPYIDKFKNFVERAVTFSRIESQLEDDLSKYIQFEEPVEVKGMKWIQPLVDAIQLRNVVTITHQAMGKNQPIQRELHPYLLKEYDNRWYVFGYDAWSEEDRIFGLDRIKQIKPTKDKEFNYFTGDREEVFKHTLGVSRFVGDPQEIKLKFYYPQAEYILSKPIHESQKFIDQDDDSITIKLFLRINYELRALIRSYGDQVKVIEPNDLLK
jgi:predicted DNA-binding transcriptional regulator YafY